jgi:hypothetical protein
MSLFGEFGVVKKNVHNHLKSLLQNTAPFSNNISVRIFFIYLTETTHMDRMKEVDMRTQQSSIKSDIKDTV